MDEYVPSRYAILMFEFPNRVPTHQGLRRGSKTLRRGANAVVRGNTFEGLLNSESVRVNIARMQLAARAVSNTIF
jgi:hypothetical protein